MPHIVDWLDRTLYPESGKNWDDVLFRREILQRITPDSCVLDLGAGAGLVEQMNFRGRAATLCGIDPDPRVLDNPYLDDARIGVGESIPYPADSFELVFADNVLEHLEDPQSVFREVARTLKPGGRLMVKTPNRRHYVPVIARATPHWFHRWINRVRGRHADDTFPTRYRANTPGDLRRIATAAGLVVQQISLVEGRPEYMRISWPTYLLGSAYERLVNHVPGLQSFRVVMMAVLQKPRHGVVAADSNETRHLETEAA